ncbi:hypothetical protein [Glutamicibacter protophormiae]|uniref:hypothetical protein n=1 Tax=Glutamicibacter protophormiae TaxID=37930 RepID=UPI0033305836
MENQPAPASPAQKEIPFRSLHEDQWAQVPRGIPDLWLSVGAWVPLGTLLFYLIRFAPQPLVFGSWAPVLLTYSFFIGVIVLLGGAGRHAAWIGLAAAIWFDALLEPTGTEQQVLQAAMGYFGLLAIAGLIGQLRFAALLNSWRRQAQERVKVPVEALQPLRYTQLLPPWMWGLTSAIVAWPLLKAGWQFFTGADMDFAAIDAELYYELGVGLGVTALVQLVGLFKWLESRSVPLMALEIPVAPDIGPLGFIGLGNALPAAQLQPFQCSCAAAEANSKAEDFKYPGWILASEQCAVHGIRAVNELAPEQFLKIAREPWVYGANAAALQSAATGRMVIAGLYGWGAKPVRLGVRGFFSGGLQTGAQLLPATAREPLRRADRSIRWVDPQGNALLPEAADAGSDRVIDRLNLASVGLRGHAVRVAGQRVRFEDSVARVPAARDAARS